METCPGCGAVLAQEDGPRHAYIGASPACWARYGELLAREFGAADTYIHLHQLTVDTYAVQHPGRPERRAIQSVCLHLATLCLVLERGADPRHGPKLHRALAGREGFHWLEPPRPNGTMTVLDVLAARDPDEHGRLVRAWARDVWDAWAPHHDAVRAWIEQIDAVAR